MEEKLQTYTNAKEQFAYWHENIDWLQKRFPEAKYVDVTGLCKIADKTEYAEEQDYSLNAGRYVGVVIEDDNISEDEFKTKFDNLHNKLLILNKEASKLMVKIENVKL